MVNINDCTVRYWLGKPEMMQSHLTGDMIRSAMRRLSDLLPEYLFHTCDDGPDERILRILQGYTCGYDFFCHKEEL